MKRQIGKIMLVLAVIAMGLSANADYSVTTSEPLYNSSPISYNEVQPYMTQYNTGYQNPYQTQCQGQYTNQQYINPYAYRNGYGYGYGNPYSTINPLLNAWRNNTTTSTAGNLGKSLLYSLVRGY